jgi:outer membrane protein assembly factor BamB
VSRRALFATAAAIAAVAAVAAVTAVGAIVAHSGSTAPAAQGTDWPLFGFDTARHNAVAAGLSVSEVRRLHRRRVRLPGTVDSSPIYLHDVRVGSRAHDTFFVTTTYGRTAALDAQSGTVLWLYTPPSYSRLAGSYRITNASPVADPSRQAIYAAAPDGNLRKLRVRDGKVLWTTSITRDPTHEKITASLTFSRGRLIAATGGYIGDTPPYQGHVVTLNPTSGRILSVWNSLCSDRHALIQPSSCAASDSAIWARSGVAVDPASGDLLFATGNAPWDGRLNWGDSLLVLDPTASRLLRHWTPTDEASLNDRDADLGSTGPALLAGGYVAQSGKDGKLRLLQLSKLPGVSAEKGGELQTVPTPGGAGLFSAPAVWRGTWLFVADDGGLDAWQLKSGRLVKAWSASSGGTSPVVARGLLYVARNGGLDVYVASSGKRVATLPFGTVHWQSPIVADGRVAVAEGSANDHLTTGILDIYR